MKILKKHFANTVAFLCLFAAVAETAIADKHAQEPPTSLDIAQGAHKHAETYVDAEAAGYDTLSDGKEVRARHFQVLAIKQPAAPVCRIGSPEHWDAFIKEFAGIEIATGKQLRFKPDFKREQVLALFAGPDLRGDGYMGIELYDGDTLQGFVFHGSPLAGKDPIAISKAAGRPFCGTLYLTTVPKQLAHKAIEFHMGYQSWGRACSRFSPSIANSPRPKQGVRLPVKFEAEMNEPGGKSTKELRLFDPSIFGKQPSEPVALLLPGKKSVQPLRVQVDLKEGCYAAATVTYDKVDFEEARRSLNKRYKKYELKDYVNNKQLALWRNTQGKYAIQLSSLEDEDLLQIIYISFQAVPK